MPDIFSNIKTLYKSYIGGQIISMMCKENRFS